MRHTNGELFPEWLRGSNLSELELAFLLGFGASVEGFNSECASEHCSPDDIDLAGGGEPKQGGALRVLMDEALARLPELRAAARGQPRVGETVFVRTAHAAGTFSIAADAACVQCGRPLRDHGDQPHMFEYREDHRRL